MGLVHDARAVRSELEVIRVASVQDLERTRYQATVNSEFRQGLVRPFGEMDFRYTESDSIGRDGDPLYEVGSGMYGKRSVPRWRKNARGLPRTGNGKIPS